MYNTEKYIAATLESLLDQTFQDFEVIVVDDCSTDGSVGVVESYIPRFGGRLKISRMAENSGPAAPSNLGVALSRGEYVYVIDSDDLLVKDALGTLYKFARDSGADAVFMDCGFRFENGADKPFPAPENLQICGWHAPPFVDRPTFESDNIAERVKKFASNGMGWTAISKFVSRDLLIENNITFPLMRTSQDLVWVMEVIACAKKILTIPHPLYIHRPNPTSNTATRRTPEKHIQMYMNAHVYGLKAIDEFLTGREFFQQNPQCKWDLFDFFERVHFNTIVEHISRLPPYEFSRILESKFSEKFGEYADVLAYLCTSTFLSRMRWALTSQRSVELENRLKQLQGG